MTNYSNNNENEMKLNTYNKTQYHTQTTYKTTQNKTNKTKQTKQNNNKA